MPRCALRLRLLLAAALPLAVVTAVAATFAAAGTPLSPVGGAKTTSTPTLTWSLGPNEKFKRLLVSPRPTVASDGRLNGTDTQSLFAGIRGLTDRSTSYSYRPGGEGREAPLPAGVWYWQIQTTVTDENGGFTEPFSPVASFVVAATLSGFRADMSVQQQTANVTVHFKTNSLGLFVVKCKTTYNGKTFGTGVARETSTDVLDCKMRLRGGLTSSNIVTVSATMTGPGGLKGTVSHRLKVYSAAIGVRGSPR